MSSPNAALPGAPHLARDAQGRLMLEGCDLDALARQHGTPLYVYSSASIAGALAAYQRGLAGQPHLLCYAVKANSNLGVLRLLAGLGAGFDIVSRGELERVLTVTGGDASRVVFSGVGKTAQDMQRALEVGVACFNVESEAELELLAQVAAGCGHVAPVSLRINPHVDPKTHPYISTGLKSNKFGIAHDRALAVYQRASQLPGLRVVGIDCHIGSQITQSDPFLEALDRLLDLVDALAQAGIAIHHVDIGGGLGIQYADETPPAADALLRQVIERLHARGHGSKSLWLEPGRSLVGNAGVLLTQVQYVKPGETKNFCIVDAAMNDLLRPALYEAWMQITECVAPPASAPRQRMDVVGPVCESGDWLGRERDLAVQAGDTLAVLSAGAYGMVMASNYNTRARAAEVLVKGDGHRVVRRREQLADLWAHELPLE
ncbi:diaminopimelate decarboxylase [Amphibiibacter pelophylacis]|uniref:Diaminopimelate decarboxylase n=1 Tax=Amphibiibacter pelophylacis TaxID=1799477 RepID=A0ACC6P0F8_9BURK